MADDDFSRYLTWPPEDLYARLGEVTTFLATKIRELGFVEVQNLRTDHDAYHQSQEPTHAAAKRAADYSTIELRIAIAELKSEVAALQEEKFFIVRLIDRGK